MLVICEDCAKKYSIDESKIKGDKARFSCLECGHIIVVRKSTAPSGEDEQTREHPSEQDPGQNSVERKTTQAETETSENGGDAAPPEEAKEKERVGAGQKERGRDKSGPGTSIGFYLFCSLVTGFISLVLAFGFLYLKYIPELMNHQIDLRTSAISTIFAGSVSQPLLVRDYLKVNREAERISRVEGVAYAAVVNKRGVVVAGFFNNLSRFDPVFASMVKNKGFPADIFQENRLGTNASEKTAQFLVGGQRVQDRAIRLPETGSVVHVGVFLEDVQQIIRKALLSPLSLSVLGGLFLAGLIVFFFISRAISRPLIALTDVVNRISLGELDLEINPSGPKEVRELGKAFERMRFSIKSALERLKRNW